MRKRFKMLTIVEHRPGSKVLCLCDCGNFRLIQVGHFNAGYFKSCGCHVLRHNRYKSREYNSWSNMISRCHNKNNKRYKDYGARGIIVCDRWRESFKYFFEDMGICPDGYQIDRINNNGIYEPSNCRWVTPKENMANREKSVIYYVDNKKFLSSIEAASYFGVSANTILAWCKGRKTDKKWYPPKKGCYVITNGYIGTSKKAY